MGCLRTMSSKKVSMEAKSKSSQSRKNRRRSTRNANVTNGEAEDPKERCGKRPRDINAKENADCNMEDGQDCDVYKEIIDLLPASDLNCSPAEVPAPPGTRVNLHGVILHETQGGLIVLNVRWRNKVYSGALIDAEKNKWATDRIASGDGSPLVDDNKQFQAPPPIKKLRIPTNSANTTPAEDSDSGNNKKKGTTSPTTTPTKTTPKTPRGNGKKRGTQESPPAQTEETTPAKKSKGRLLYNGEHLYECAEPNCEKKYKNKNGLSYHLRTMHPTKMESCDESGKENKSDNSRDESDSGDDNFVIDEKADEESKDGDSEDKSAVIEEQNGSQSDGEGEEEKREELTENEKQIDRLKLEAEKVQAVLSNMKHKAEVDDIKQEDMDCGGDEAIPLHKPAGKMEGVKIEEGYDEDDVESKIFDNIEGEAVEPLVDVESDSMPNYQWKGGDTKDVQSPISSSASAREGKIVIPTIKVDPSPNEEDDGGDESGDHPKGTSRTIIHEDHINSLNELFAPTQTYHQYSPTLTNLNPQKINESLTDALSKQPTVSTMTTVTSSLTKMENTEAVKEVLAAKPSIEINRNEPTPTPVTTLENRLSSDLTKSNEYCRAPMDYVACSDDERSISPENALTGCHKTFPQDERDVKTTKPNLVSIALNTSSMYMNPLLQSMLEQSILGQSHNLLGQTQRPFEKGLIFKELGNKCSNAAMNMNSFQNKIPTSMPNIPNTMALQDNPLVSNIDPKSLSNVLNPSAISSDSKNILPFDQSREYPLKPSLLEQRLLAHTQTTKSTDSTSVAVSNTIGNNNIYLSQNTSFDPIPQTREYPLKPSLLEQRLLAEPVKNDAMITSNITSNNKMFLQQPDINLGVPLSRPGGKPDENNKNNDNNEEAPITSSFTVNRDLISNEKTKSPATSLRINPPTSLEERVQIGTHTWFPEVVNDGNQSLATPDYYNSPPIVSSSFRIPVPKTYPSYSIQSAVNTSMSDPKNPKNIAKRAMQPVPIAPAPTPSLQPSRNEFSAPPLDYLSPNGDKEQSQMSRFTLTSDNRLIPSPAENRGRPRKVRVEKTKQIPIGTAQDIAKVRGPAETSLPRKPSSSSPVVRTSVIQGSIHPGLDGSPKPNDRGTDGHMMFPQCRDIRNYDMPTDDRERFNAHEKELKPPIEIRNNEKYQGIGSPPGMYFSPPVGRGLLSPPLPRSASHSPRSVDMLTRPVDVLTRPGAPLPRSSPVGGHHDGFSKAQFQMALERMAEYNPGNNPGPEHARNVLEHARRKSELLRPVSESPHDNRKHPLSPLSETLHVMHAYARAHEIERDQRMAEYLGSGRYQPPPGVRGDFSQGRSETPRSMFEHRISPAEENEQTRLLRERERYIQQNTLSRTNVFRGSPPSHSGAPQPGHHSANLVLGTADGSIIGPLSSYENRPAEHKR